MEYVDRINRIIASQRATADLPQTSQKKENIPTCQIKYECSICKDIGWIFTGENNNNVKSCKCQDAKKYKDILKNCGLSDAFLRKTFETYTVTNKRQQEVKNKALQYIKGFEKKRNERNNSICLIGQVGSGKTHLGIAICNILMKKNIGVIYMQYREAMSFIKQNMTKDVYNLELDRYKLSPVLFLDDLYKGFREADLNIIYEIINYRYLKYLPIIVTSEFNSDKILDFDEATGSRIIEMCKGNVIEFVGDDLNYRLK